jgi:hypothetical protein
VDHMDVTVATSVVKRYTRLPALATVHQAAGTRRFQPLARNVTAKTDP